MEWFRSSSAWLFVLLLAAFIGIPALYFSYVPIWDGWQFSRCYLTAAITGSLWCFDHSAFVHTYLFGLTQKPDPGNFHYIYAVNIFLGVLGLLCMRALLGRLYKTSLSPTNITLVSFVFGLTPVFLVQIVQPSLDLRLIEKGDAEMMNELFSNFLLAIIAGVLMVFAVLVLLFARVFQPITILSALPLSIGGAAVALMLTGKALSLPAVIGVLMLMGIVAKNSILLVEYANQLRSKGHDAVAAILEAGRIRFRPILMTSVATVMGVLPIASGTGPGATSRRPLGYAIVGGLSFSTVLTLFVVPVVWLQVERVMERRRAARTAAAPSPALHAAETR